jgi:predicted small secreted protein
MNSIKTTAARLAIGFALMLPIVAGVAACNTTAGAGKDVSAAGNAVSNAANAAK